MTSSPKHRLEALKKQLSSPPSDSNISKPIPEIRQKAPDSVGQRVKGKVIIISGANSPLGIGRASAHQFAHNGALAIYICDFNDEFLETHKQELNTQYPDVDIHTRHFDASDERATKGVIDEAISKYGRLDILFANAGIVGSNKLFWDISDKEFMKTMRTNVLRYLPFLGKPNQDSVTDLQSSVFLAFKHASLAMRLTSPSKPHANGSLIATASVAGLRSNAGSTDYSASKAAVISLVQTTAYQLAGTNVRCNAICPGLIETGMTSTMYEGARKKGTEGKIGQLNPMRRGGVADEVARVALFLGSEEGSYVNGQAWAVDGGLSAGHPSVLGKMH
ncbi:MAG: hypothetical protein LQ343_006963 [Gyalolechia ehrenbergii]|nr:MAG: hypothetical protein LQ343_006963 [Gyalolechia ehrenbergii]